MGGWGVKGQEHRNGHFTKTEENRKRHKRKRQDSDRVCGLSVGRTTVNKKQKFSLLDKLDKSC